MTVAYWIVVTLLGLFYLYSGAKKATQSRERLAPMMAWVDTVPMPLVRLIGAVEIAGVAGLVLPPLTGRAPALAMVAALGFVLLQLLAAGLHLSRGEAKETALNWTLIALAGVTAWLATTF
ncbi:DoxX family protein [Streptomyces flavalbus]|uniref:DoxX family protein n=1 Tax=Streptomyces flavalbus TaxID=2665155 RepID=A0ABW2W4X0_9ACTN